jgi:uncharacterized membrane protein
MKRMLSYFFKGLLFVLPLTLTIYILYASIRFLDGLLNFEVPGLGIIVVLAGLTLLGYLFTHVIPNPLLQLMENGISRMPLIKLIYSSIKDLTEAFVGDKKRFNQPVMVEMSNSGIHKIGFITETDLSKLDIEGMVAVYFPHSYNFSGNLFIVPADKVKKLNAGSSDIMKFIVSAGVSSISGADEKDHPQNLKKHLDEWMGEGEKK